MTAATDSPDVRGSAPTAHRAARLMQIGFDALALVLALLVVWRGGDAWPYGATFGLVYVVGRAVLGPVVRHGSLDRRGRPRLAVAWAVALTALALAAGVVGVEGIWLAFPVFLVQLHVLRTVAGIVAVALTTLATVVVGATRDGPGLGAVLGPVLGAAVCIGVVVGVRAVITESEERRRLFEELAAARQVLAEQDRDAAVAAERHRLAREIHDTLAQGLASIELLLRAADGELTAGGAERARELVGTARTAAQDNLAEARSFVRDLPSPLVEEGLVGALERLAEQSRRRSGIDVTVTVADAPRPLPTAVTQALWRVAQQALANAVEHASASRVTLTLGFLGDTITLDVVDDGVGLAPGARERVAGGETAGRGTGLPGMTDRVRAVGGTLSIESRPGAGTAIGVAVPL